MIMLNQDNNVIYESPDGGDTIYSRTFGDYSIANRKLIKRPWEDECSNHLVNDQLWYNIRNDAITNSGLHELLEQAITFYRLSKEE
jgi:hypothetical protein